MFGYKQMYSLLSSQEKNELALIVYMTQKFRVKFWVKKMEHKTTQKMYTNVLHSIINN